MLVYFWRPELGDAHQHKVITTYKIIGLELRLVELARLEFRCADEAMQEKQLSTGLIQCKAWNCVRWGHRYRF